ncbi:MAG: PKD domain-containing protein, partial [Caldithrix sp.]|nr:PKD domain-containing protein [Caldithrix sp.]
MFKKYFYNGLILSLVFTASLWAQTSISEGDVSGTWTAANSPYLIEGDVTVPAGQTLTIEAGVDVLFQSWYKFTVNGYLEANGTEDMPIVFTTEDTTGGWIGLRFVDAPDSSHVNYCILEFGQATGEDPLNKGGGIYMKNSNPVITNSTIRKGEASGLGGGMYMENSNPRIENSTITENSLRSGATGDGGGIYCLDSKPVIRLSHISKNSVGVSGSFSPGRGSGGGIYLDNSDAVLEYNIISQNEIGGSGNTGSYARGAAIYASSSDPVLVGNTITENVGRLDVIADEQGGIMYLTDSNADFVNNILWNNNPQDIFMAQNETTNSVMLAYCDMQGGQDSVFYGDNGTLYYQEGNIDSDPLFVNVSQEDFHLSAGSPAIDAGTDYYEWEGQVLVDLQSDEYVGSAPDMGALEYNSGDDINQPPSAIIESDKVEGSAPLTVSFDASKSYDDDGSISSYHWDFDDGNTSTDISPVHTFSDSNTYYVELTVTDNDGAYDREVIKIYAHGGTSIPEGNISGTWTKSGSPYYIEGDVTVPTGESLTIEAGVEVIFKSWYHFYVHGLLQADGTDTMPITFTPEDTTNTWRGMRISDASDDTYLKWCTLEFGDATGENPLDRGGALYVLNTSPTIENSTFRKSEAGDHGGGIYLENAHAVIDGCTITENTSGTGTTNYG